MLMKMFESRLALLMVSDWSVFPLILERFANLRLSNCNNFGKNDGQFFKPSRQHCIVINLQNIVNYIVNDLMHLTQRYKSTSFTLFSRHMFYLVFRMISPSFKCCKFIYSMYSRSKVSRYRKM